MGIGFNLFFIFILVPVTGILFVKWLISGKKIFGETFLIIWLGIFGLALIFEVAQWLSAKTILEKKDYYGEYVVNRDFFPGRQSDWQYDNFRFEIKDNDSIYFHVTNKYKILKTYRGSIATIKSYRSERLLINMEQPTHHIMTSSPTIYRSAWSFYLVFNSPKFNNVFFKKGKWKPRD
ncbi:MAG: hypothetical protein V2A54_05665 [Bacteroidota bacterium]